MGALSFPGPLCRYRLLSDSDPGTLCRGPSPVPGTTNGPSLWPELSAPDFLPAAFGLDTAITKADQDEFKIVKKMPVFDSKRRPYRTVNQYVSDRTFYFGPPSVYTSFAAESDAELANTKWVGKKRTRTLSSMIEFNHEPKKQQIFYRWVRQAYRRKYGPAVDVPELIRKGMSQELADRIQEVRGSIRVKKNHEDQFHAGGFNPRPIKYNHHYLFGTLSEHATGMAVDIDDSQNPQLTREEWQFIEKLTGKTVLRVGRWKTEAAAEAFWKDIKNLSDSFVAKVASEVSRIGKERAEAAKAAAASKPVATQPPKPPAVAPLQEVLGKHYAALSPWITSGFLHLPLELVLELHAHGFVWGATFGTNVDLHHFELPE